MRDPSGDLDQGGSISLDVTIRMRHQDGTYRWSGFVGGFGPSDDGTAAKVLER